MSGLRKPPTPESPTFSTHEDLMNALQEMRGDQLEEDGGRIISYRGCVDAKLMIVGEAPGEEEDVVGQPVAGKSGQLLDDIFRYGGFDLGEQINVTNIVKRRSLNNRILTQK